MKNIFRKLLKLLGFLLIALLLLFLGIYIYLALQTGEKATDKAIFQNEKSSFLVFAHRGGGGLYPENTLEAFQNSVNLGVDFLELDIHSTKDGKIVVMHDSTVNRTTNGNGKISEITLADLKKLDAGYNFSTDKGQTFPFRDKNITVSTLAEIFDNFPNKKINIEIKPAETSIIKPFCDLLREKNMTEKVIISSFRQEVLDNFRQSCPEIATSASSSEIFKFLVYQKLGLAENYRPKFQALQIPQKFGRFQIVTKNFIESAHKLNLQVHVWTINESVDMKRLIELGVGGIMTDYPDRLLELTTQKRENSEK